MRVMVLGSAIMLTTALLSAQDDKAEVIRFDKSDLGKVPSEWTAEQTGKGEGSVWKVVTDETAPSRSGLALAQTAEGPNALFNLCVMKNKQFRDVDISVSFKAVRGQKDQGGGIVWRYQDANNYYVARMNPLEDNYRLYHVVAGKRTQFGGKEGLKVPAGEWHTLRVKMTGEKIECYLDGREEIEASDKTITKAGGVGLWTKADAQSHFDGFTVRGK